MEKNSFIVSIDLGCNKTVAALGIKTAEGKVAVADIVSTPMQGIVRGEVSNIEMVTSSLKEAIGLLEQRNEIEVKEAFVGISGQHIVCAANSGFVYVGGTDGEIKEEDVKKLCENMNNVQPPEGRVILSSIPQSYKVDSQEITTSPVGMFGHRLEATFNFILGGKSVIDRQSKAFDRVGVKCKGLFVSGMASAIAAATDDEKEMGVAVIDIGAGTTDICIYHENIVRYAAVIPMGADAINKDIKATAIPERIIEELKIKYGYATTSTIPADKLNCAIRIPARTAREKYKDISYRDLSTIIEARMSDIVDYVIDEIKESGYQGRLGAGIVLTGGGSNLAGVDTLFKERTGYEVRLGAAEYNLDLSSVESAFDTEMTAVVGLLLLGMGISSVKPSALKQPQASATTKKINDLYGQDDEQEQKPAESDEPSEPAKDTEKQKGRKSGKKPKIGTLLGKIFDTTFGVIDDEDL